MAFVAVSGVLFGKLYQAVGQVHDGFILVCETSEHRYLQFLIVLEKMHPISTNKHKLKLRI